MKKPIDLMVNGSRHTVTVDPAKSLLQVLRDDMDLTGCKYGCGEGQCGACTVLIAGKATRSCITPVGTAAGKQITTIEGTDNGGYIHALQQAFVEADAMQCGYCIPGMILSAAVLLSRIPHPTDAEIVQGMQGNICRCGTYPRIVTAIRKASKYTRRASR